MNHKIEELKSEFSTRIEKAKEKLNETKTKIHNFTHKSTEEAQNAIELKKKEVNEKLEENQQILFEKKKAVESSIAEFKERRNLEAAKKRAKKSKEYAAACIALAFAIIEEADVAISHAVIAEQELNAISN